jgi:hypothetical protein
MPHLGRYQRLTERVEAAAMGLRALLEQHRGAIARVDLQVATHVVANAIHSLTHDGALPRPDSLDDETLATEATRLVVAYLTTLPRDATLLFGDKPRE